MDPRKLSLQELLLYCLETQDLDAWTELVRRTRPLIAGVVNRCVFRRIGPKLDLVDDLVQETYKKLCVNNFKALRDFNFQDEPRFYGFLKVVASRLVEDYFRRKESDKHGGGREDDNIDDVRPSGPFRPNLLQPAEMAILMEQIEVCLMKLASEPNFARDHAIFWLYYRQGLTANAISQLPGIKLGTKGVESTLLRLTRYVKGCLTAPPPPPRKQASGG